MKSMLIKTLVVLFVLIVQNQILQAQQYSINGSLGLDTIPEYKLDVNGDGHFKGELLLDDDLRMLKLASTDSLLQKLLYVDEDGRMNRLGEDGARDIITTFHTMPCYYKNENEPPVVPWKELPGKTIAYDENCPDYPDVGIGTDDPKARLDVRGSGYFQKELGIGAVNDQNEARLLVRTNSSLPGILLRSNLLIGGIPTDVDVFKVRSNGHVSIDRTTSEAYSFGLDIRVGDELTKAFRIWNDISEEEVLLLWGDGKVEQKVLENNGDHAFRLRNMALEGDQELFNVRNNGRMQLKFIGDNEHLNVFRIERGNAPQVNDDSNIFAVKGTGRTQINFSGQSHQTAFGIKGGDDSSSDYLFHVKGDGHISAAAVHVRELGNFPDYVFEPDYDLMPLEKLRRYIADNKRLPNMPSAKEVELSGVDLGEMNRLLVEKVEELTLYVLQLEERLTKIDSK